MHLHSLTKWKRWVLKTYGFKPGEGLYTDMNAIRRDEMTDNIHSILCGSVGLGTDHRSGRAQRGDPAGYGGEDILHPAQTKGFVCAHYPHIRPELSEKIAFVTTQELEDCYPELSPKEREYKAVREHGAVFLMGIGGALKSGNIHDGRAPDYDDWSLNGDILLYDSLLDISLEVSSMGIRVNPEALRRQLAIRGCEEWQSCPSRRRC